MKKHNLVKKDMEKKSIYKNRKALSSVVMMVIMIALVMAIAGVIFTLTRQTVEEEIDKTESCGLNIIDKLFINDLYVCYDSSEERMVFSINREDIEMDKILIALETETEIIKYEIENSEENIPGVYDYPNGLTGSPVSLPGKNGGKTYFLDISEKPIQIQIAPIINDEQCDFIDSINNIVDCTGTTIL